jgi:hypothetical protein
VSAEPAWEDGTSGGPLSDDEERDERRRHEPVRDPYAPTLVEAERELLELRGLWAAAERRAGR